MSVNHKAIAASNLMVDVYLDEGAANLLAVAQVHATLALVEATDALVAAQGLANQIAWHAQGHAGRQTRNEIDRAVNL